MRRILVLSFVLVLGFGLVPNASATHTTDACHASALIATNTMGATCPLILQCPLGSATCTWDLNVTADGIGYVRASAVQLETGRTAVACGPQRLNCTATILFALSPPSVVNFDCYIFGGEVHPALLANLTCTATATGHV